MARFSGGYDGAGVRGGFEKDVPLLVAAQHGLTETKVIREYIDDFDVRPGDDSHVELAGVYVFEAVDQSTEVKGSAIQLDARAVLCNNLAYE